MKSLKGLIKSVFSEALIGKATGIFYGWHGNYASWAEAKKDCQGYEQERILEKVIETSLRVKSGEVVCERDSVPFNKPIYSYPVLAGLMWVATQRNNRLNVIDFGGSLGSSYYQNLFFLNTLSQVNWSIIEQPHFVDAGREHFADSKLHFYYSVDECLADQKTIDVALLSSVLQYLEKPYDFLIEITSKNIPYVIIDRTLSYHSKQRLTVQKVPKKIYNASYPCWILNEKKLLDIVLEKYNLIYDFEIGGAINITCQHKGYFFAIKK